MKIRDTGSADLPRVWYVPPELTSPHSFPSPPPPPSLPPTPPPAPPPSHSVLKGRSSMRCRESYAQEVVTELRDADESSGSLHLSTGNRRTD